MKKIIQSALCAALILGLNACANNEGASNVGNSEAANAKTVITEEELGLRKENLYTEQGIAPVTADFTKPAPGMSKKIDRSYENAPPLIPHSVDGMLPITIKNNACTGCHMPAVAKSVNATPISPTHFKDFFAETKENLKKYKGSKVHADESDIAPQRYNCSQCHVPQANVKPLVENKFQPDYRNPNEKQKSNLIDTLNEGVR
ncbi:nitrate reductase cytochrome c-type subunit [Hydrogenimonas thermophila]|uniref:Periplasmic nitrate reductase, electron transfer subunit n=1 Tax=Hydrogenimonas thermophila TaxID=223786 RepID=A0A1I5L4S2_9BACT|nr:nitrate reductase cytochrome c-type subunit [Hydrogenimonas thermophila]SFO92320.1 periplasmic nitrate reductase subunit NapB [Hydrogenimonas thermophila]